MEPNTYNFSKTCIIQKSVNTLLIKMNNDDRQSKVVNQLQITSQFSIF